MTTRMNNNFAADGFCIIDNIYSSEETDSLLRSIAKDTNQPAFRKTNELFAIRQFFKAIPAALPLVFNKKLKKIISEYFGNDFFVVKSIYSISLKLPTGLLLTTRTLPFL